jgi:hypothetical protein
LKTPFVEPRTTASSVFPCNLWPVSGGVRRKGPTNEKKGVWFRGESNRCRQMSTPWLNDGSSEGLGGSKTSGQNRHGQLSTTINQKSCGLLSTTIYRKRKLWTIVHNHKSKKMWTIVHNQKSKKRCGQLSTMMNQRRCGYPRCSMSQFCDGGLGRLNVCDNNADLAAIKPYGCSSALCQTA